MKKNFMKVGLAIAAAMVVMTGCGNSDNTETTAATETTVAAGAEETKSAEELSDEASITLGDYKGLTLTIQKDEIADQIIGARMDEMAADHLTEVTGRAAQMGDIANIDYKGMKDGVAFDGGTAEGHNLTLGSGAFIPGFEEGVVGMEIGEEKEIPLTFPEQYHSEELAGQEVVFHVTLNALTDTTLTDEIAKSVLEDDKATLDDFRAMVQEEVDPTIEQMFYVNASNELLMQAVANSDITCDPDALEQNYQMYADAYTMTAEMYGMNLEDYMSTMYGMSLDDLRSAVEEILKQEMVLQEILTVEGVKATEEQKLQYAGYNGYDSIDALVEALGEETAEKFFQQCAVRLLLIENSVTE